MIYLITGDDVFEREKEVQKLKEKMGELIKGINFVTINKENLSSLASEVTTYPFGYPKKFILVNVPSKSTDAEETSVKSDWFSDALAEEMLQSTEVNEIVFVGDVQVRARLYQFVQKNGKCIECHTPKSKKDLAPWVVAQVHQNEKQISLENAQYMLQICGANKLMLSQEIQKLVDYIGEKTEIQKQDIAIVGIRTLETIIFDLTDAVGSRNIAVSLQYLEELLLQKEPLQKIFIMIAKQFEMLYLTKICLQENKNVAEELNIKFPFIVSKYKDQSRRFTKEELESMLIRLADLDTDSKVGKIDLRMGLEMCLIQSQ